MPALIKVLKNIKAFFRRICSLSKKLSFSFLWVFPYVQRKSEQESGTKFVHISATIVLLTWLSLGMGMSFLFIFKTLVFFRVCTWWKEVASQQLLRSSWLLHPWITLCLLCRTSTTMAACANGMTHHRASIASPHCFSQELSGISKIQVVSMWSK